ncbi:hypothetical protein COCVIDRAFT_80446, partial [Bipolaris victoriae FI3]
PINCAVKDHPLIFTDSRTVAETDLVSVEQVYPCYTGERFAVSQNAGQKFWYCKDMS